jgi:lipoprotein-anchoring transpeptidase ErfK/SrfK
LALLVSAVSWNWFVQSIHARSSVALPTPVVTVTEQPPTSPKESPPANNLTLIAHLPGDVPAYSEPGIPTGGTVAGEWWDYPSILPVLEERDGFYKVRIQQRPNGSTVWIAAEGIETSVTPYRMVIDVTKYRVILFELGKVVLDVPAMVGREHTPTPVGEFFVTMLYPGSSPGYGKQMVVLSAHSETIDDWQGSGDAITAIHGPLGNEASIDTVGAGSNGCVRLHMADLDALVALVVPGTPVDIVAS